MADFKQLKDNIEKKNINDNLIVFQCSENSFIADQYVEAISNILDLPISYVDDFNSLFANDLFGFAQADPVLSVFVCTDFDTNKNVSNLKNVIIICNKLKCEIEDRFVYKVPKLEQWQIKDYVYSVLPGISTKDLDGLLEICKYDIYRIQNEIDKLLIFSEIERQSTYEDFVADDVFSDLSKYTIFDFTNAIIKNDKEKLLSAYKEIKNIDIEPFGVLTVLTNSFRDIIRIQLDPRLTPEQMGILKNKFWAIKYSCGVYSKDKLLSIYHMLCGLDSSVKQGLMPTEHMIDYIVMNIME